MAIRDIHDIFSQIIRTRKDQTPSTTYSVSPIESITSTKEDSAKKKKKKKKKSKKKSRSY